MWRYGAAMSWRITVSLVALCGSVACGGSSSESPWPVEPVDTDPGPAGESGPRGNVVDTKKLPDNYSEKESNGEAEGEPDDEPGDAAPDADAEPDQ
jgi:hypothetical protein